jgi:hypothetical protein
MRRLAIVIALGAAACRHAPPTATPASTPAPDPSRPPNVAPVELESLRVSGSSAVRPNEMAHAAMIGDGRTKVVGTFKVCIDTAGVPTGSVLRSTDYEAFDQQILDEIATWRYRPFLSNGAPAPVCSAVTFIVRL